MFTVTSCYKGNFQEVIDPLTALIILPLINLPSILKLAENGLSQPSGITHFLIRICCIYFNYPLDEYSNNLPTSAKQEHMDLWIEERIRSRNKRYDLESTILFDD